MFLFFGQSVLYVEINLFTGVVVNFAIAVDPVGPFTMHAYLELLGRLIQLLLGPITIIQTYLIDIFGRPTQLLLGPTASLLPSSAR